MYSRIQSGIVVFEKLTPEIVKDIMLSKMKRFVSRLKEENNITITDSNFYTYIPEEYDPVKMAEKSSYYPATLFCYSESDS